MREFLARAQNATSFKQNKRLNNVTISKVILSTENIMMAIIMCLIALVYSSDLQAKQLILHQKQTPQQEEVQLTPSEKIWLKNHGLIKVAVKSGWMPIEFQLENQLHRGYTIDYLEKIANLLQIDFEVVNFSENFNTSNPDIISSVSGNSITDNTFNFLRQPYLVLPNAVYMNKERANSFRYMGLESLQDATIAVYKKGELIKQLQKNYPKLNIVTVDISDEAFDYVKYGKVDAYIGNEFVIDYHIEVQRIDAIKKVGLTPFTSEVSMAVRNDAPELSTIMEKATTAIGQNNPDLLNRWVKRKSNKETLLIVALALILFTFIIVTIRYFRLKNEAMRERAADHEKIWHQANFDYLTELPNRHQFKRSLTKIIVEAEQRQSQVCLMFIDLDEFKQVNDTSGHSVGDKLLKDCALRITKCLKESDITARVGGDEFMIIFSEFEDKSTIASTCEKILSAIQLPFEIDKNTFFISASIGATFYPDNSSDTEELVRYADQAMYESKNLGKNRYQFFTKSMQMAVANKAEMINDIRLGIQNNQFELYYQPIINMADVTTGKAEALIRWNHPKKGIVNPLDFIYLAEESGLINELGDWVFKQATDDLITINKAINAPFHLSINVSPFQFTRPESLFNWINILNEKNIDGKHICLEITESLLLEPSKSVIEVIQSLSKYGVQFAIDDFGTGYSALGYLQNFKIDYIKIDKSFTQNLDSNYFNSTLCHFIIQMAHQLDIKLIAEGVEVIAQEDILNTLQCDYAQGYFYGKPMPLSRFIDDLKK